MSFSAYALCGPNMVSQSGNQPAVLVWECSTGAFISELKDFIYGVQCISFSPNGEHLVSVGGYIYLWDWRSRVLVTKLKASSSCSVVTSVSFSSDTKFIVTAGKKHLKFWTFGSSLGTCINNRTGPLALHGKPVNLGPQKGSSFISVTSAIRMNNSSGTPEEVGKLYPIYALTDGGILCLVDDGLSIRKSVDIKVEKCFALSVSSKLIACGCCNGIVKLFTCETLNYAGSLLYSRAKSFQGETDILVQTSAIEKDFQLAPALPDAVACQFSTSEKLVVVYGDHSLYIWDIQDMNKATRCCALVSHSACIWDVKNLCCENIHDPSLACVSRGCSGGISFATCSADGTIRLWDLALQPNLVEDGVDHHSLNANPLGTTCLASAGIFERDTVGAGISTQGFRSMAASSDGKYLAAGDCEGNLHIYDLLASDYTCFQGIHDADILSLSFSMSSKKHVISEEVVDGNYFLASEGRDRIIHLYDAKRNFDLVGSIDDHSAAVTSVKLTSHGHKIISCSADRSLVFRDVSTMESGWEILRRHHQMASHGTVYDMALDPAMEFVVTVGQDKKINTFDVASGKLIRSFKQDKDLGDPIKVSMDPSCSYLACSYSNKSMCLYDTISGEMVTQAVGHGEVITGVIFLPDCKHVVSVGGDSCIFVWKLPTCMSSRMLHRIKENVVPLSPKNLGLPVALNQILFSEDEDQQCRIDSEDARVLENSKQIGEKKVYQGGRPPMTFRFSISRLPKWAQAKVESSDSVSTNHVFASSQHLELKPVPHMLDDCGECGVSCPDVETPLSIDMEGVESCPSSLSRSSPATDISQRTQTPQDGVRNFAMDKRWLNVYTVCPDLLNSPEVPHLSDPKMPVPLSNLCEYHAVAGCVSGELPSHESGSHIQEAVEVDACHMKSEDSELFKRHFGSISTTCKSEGNKSSVRRYSAKYVVKQDYAGYSKRLFKTPVENLGHQTLSYNAEAASRITSQDPVIQNLEVQKEIDSTKQDLRSSIQNLPISVDAPLQGELTKHTLLEDSPNTKAADVISQDTYIPEAEGNNLQHKITACREALLGLDHAAENVLHSFSALGTLVSAEEISNSPGAKLYEDAGEILPLVANKLNEIAELVKCRNSGSCKRSRVEVSGLEPLLGTFAESLSERVVEILKNNLSNRKD